MPTALAAIAGLLALSGVLAAVAALVRSDHLDRNQLAGIRTRHTLHCDECWAAGHRASVPDLRRALWVGLGVAALSAGLAILGGQGWGEGVALVAAGTGYLAVLGLGFRAATTANRAARRIHPLS